MLQVNGVTLKPVEKFQYLGVTFMRNGRQDQELDTRICNVGAVMLNASLTLFSCHETNIVEKGKAINLQSNFWLHSYLWSQSWVMTEKV